MRVVRQGGLPPLPPLLPLLLPLPLLETMVGLFARWPLFAVILSSAALAASPPPEWVEMRNNSTMFWGQYSRNVEAIEAIDRDGARADLLVYGDSITAWSSGFDLSSIPGTRAVFEKHFGDLRAEPLGIPGDEIKHLYWRLLNGELPRRAPRYAVIFIGINDLVHGVPVDEIADRMDQLLTFVTTSKQTRNSHVIVQTLLPSHAKVAEVNEAYIRLARRHGATVSDCLSRQLDRSDRGEWNVWMADQLHPSLKGQDALLGCWRGILRGKSACRLPRLPEKAASCRLANRRET